MLDIFERVDRNGLHGYRQERLMAEAMDALQDIPAALRETARSFYLDGLSIAEIAARTDSPTGTVKRRLFQARKGLRQALGVPVRDRSANMQEQTTTVRKHAFPAQSPPIRIAASNVPLFSVDCPELRWWSIIPRLGEQASFAYYDASDGSFTEAVEMQAIRPARVHDVAGVEIEVRPWKREGGWQSAWTMVGRLTDRTAQYLATLQPCEGATTLRTFLDANFDWDWGEMDRTLEDRGDYVQLADGSLTRTRSLEGKSSGAGLFRVRSAESTGRASAFWRRRQMCWRSAPS